jgi:hydroxyacylglutathione hydrolase
MWDSLQRLMALPPETLVCSGHDYLTGNLAYAASVDPANPALQARIALLADMRRDGCLPMPSLLSDELATNPFLRAAQPALAMAAGLPVAPPAQVFAALRAMKDRFR